MKKLKSLILTMCFMIVVSSSNIYATNRAIQYETTTSGTTELDGKIGEWDPNDSDRPNFDGIEGSDIEGTIPGSDDYFTISVTVPLEMRFVVLPNSTNYRGSFYSPEYNIKNNGSKTVAVKVKSMSQDTTAISDDADPLYIDKMIQGDKKSQIELFLMAIDGAKRKVRLYDINLLSNEERTLCNLTANETKKVKFYSDKWDLPEYEVGKSEAKSDFNLTLEFSVATPSTVTTP